MVELKNTEIMFKLSEKRYSEVYCYLYSDLSKNDKWKYIRVEDKI